MLEVYRWNVVEVAGAQYNAVVLAGCLVDRYFKEFA